ncbi:helix-turn-helix transcriptional regulator [Jiangella sp. DSM 45060]|nr:helix-turn-helix transcriptional regulator [Jiangella sp. DSM 45060]
MPNERLRSRITAAGLTLDDIATHVEVDPKTVERWITTDRVPH